MLSPQYANPGLGSIDGRTTRHPGYAVSGRLRKRIEQVFGWTKAAAGFRKTRHRGLARVGWMFTLTATAYNLVRLPKLVGAGASSRPDSAQTLRATTAQTIKIDAAPVSMTLSATSERISHRDLTNHLSTMIFSAAC